MENKISDFGEVLNNAIKKKPMSGIALFAISTTGISVRELATKRFTPIGGVTKPIAKFTTIITPKWIGFIPNPSTIGRRIGVRIRMAGVVSITIPTSNNTRLITINTTTLLVKWARIHPLISCGTCISVSTLENAMDAAKINKIGAYVLTASTNTS